MKAERHRFVVKGTSPPTIEIDHQSRSVYVRFKRATVAKTICREAQMMHIGIDVDEDGEVIGIEAVGVKEFSLGFILQKASVSAPNLDVSRARYIPAEFAHA